MDLATRARLRMLSLAKPELRRIDPVAAADNRTAMCDARAALCIALGVPLDEIDPASGHDLSRAAYESVRASWRWNTEMHAATEDGRLPEWFAHAHAQAVAWWSARRPEFTAGDDWLAGVHKPTDDNTTHPIGA